MTTIAADSEIAAIAELSADEATIEALVESLHELAAGAARKMREHADKPDRENGVSRHGETYFAAFLHGICASIATATGEDSDELIHRYTQATR